MNSRFSAMALCLAAFASPLCHATEPTSAQPTAAIPEDTLYSSSLSLPDAPGRETMGARATGYAGDSGMVKRTSVRPFSAVAVAVKFGVGGIGFDLATPLARKFNLRGGGMFFSYSPNLTEDGLAINGKLDFRTVDAHLDWLPWAGSFHVSPGLTFYNGNHLNATATVAAGNTFTLNDVTYTSDPTGVNPVTGTFDLKLGNKVAPSLTVGWGNMIPRKPGSHWSVPFEIGFEYISTPTIALSLNGTACTTTQTPPCQPIATDKTAQANVAAEQTELQNDISALRVYPIISIGLGYKFGH